MLKDYLYYAETGDSTPAAVSEEDPDSDFEISVAAEIRRLGYHVDHQVGSSGFKLDLAVRRPDQESKYMLAVECDGATYHSAVWARERDRLRQEVLEGLGWRFHRVWSTDWFHRRNEEVRRLEAALLAASQDVPAAVPDEDMPVKTEIEIETEVAEELPQVGHSDLPDYQVAEFMVPGAVEPHDLPVSSMAPIVLKVVALEGPVHEEEIARRVAGLFGKQKAGSRIVAAVEKALLYAKRSDPSLMVSDGFWMTKETSGQVPLRNRSRALPSLRKAAMLPPAEIAQAIRKALNDNGALSWDELPRAVALLFGFLRTGPEFRPAIVPVIEAMLAGDEVVEGPAGLQLSS